MKQRGCFGALGWSMQYGGYVDGFELWGSAFAIEHTSFSGSSVPTASSTFILGC